MLDLVSLKDLSRCSGLKMLVEMGGGEEDGDDRPLGELITEVWLVEVVVKAFSSSIFMIPISF